MIKLAQILATMLVTIVPASAYADPLCHGQIIVDALGAENNMIALSELQNRLNTEMRDLGIGDGGGVLFLVKGTLYFVPKDECVCGGATQSAHRVAMPGGSNGKNGPFESKSSKLKEALVRTAVKELLCTEDIS